MGKFRKKRSRPEMQLWQLHLINGFAALFDSLIFGLRRILEP
jgi:hypothetical protein